MKAFGVEKSIYLLKDEAQQVLASLNGVSAKTTSDEKPALLPV
jgi:hypothetical protein